MPTMLSCAALCPNNMRHLGLSAPHTCLNGLPLCGSDTPLKHSPSMHGSGTLTSGLACTKAAVHKWRCEPSGERTCPIWRRWGKEGAMWLSECLRICWKTTDNTRNKKVYTIAINFLNIFSNVTLWDVLTTNYLSSWVGQNEIDMFY